MNRSCGSPAGLRLAHEHEWPPTHAGGSPAAPVNNEKKGLEMKNVVMYAVITTLALLVNYSFALECPKFPEQAKKNWEVNVSAEVAKIGPLKGADLKTSTRIITQDLLGKLPDGGRVYLEQMMFAAYCSALRDDKILTETERSKRLKEYIGEVRKVIRAKNTSKPENKPPLAKNNIAGDAKSPPPSLSTEKNCSVISHGQTGGITAQNVVIKLEDKPKPRDLAPEQKKAILTFLANEPKGVFVIKANITVPDAWSYADQIAEPFRNSGWTVRIDSALITGPNTSGVWITIKNPEAVPLSCIVLKNALETAGITFRAHYDPWGPDPGEVWLSVGSR